MRSQSSRYGTFEVEAAVRGVPSTSGRSLQCLRLLSKKANVGREIECTDMENRDVAAAFLCVHEEGFSHPLAIRDVACTVILTKKRACMLTICTDS